MLRTNSGRSICLYPGKMEDAPKLFLKIQNRNVQTFGFDYHEATGQNHGPVSKTQSFLLSESCTVILWQDCYGKRKFEKILLKHGWDKVSNWECFFSYTVKKGLFLSVYVVDIKIGWKETKH